MNFQHILKNTIIKVLTVSKICCKITQKICHNLKVFIWIELECLHYKYSLIFGKLCYKSFCIAFLNVLLNLETPHSRGIFQTLRKFSLNYYGTISTDFRITECLRLISTKYKPCDTTLLVQFLSKLNFLNCKTY